MVLDQNQVNQKLKERKKAAVINKAVRHQNRIKFHAETKVSSYSSQAVNDFLAFVKNLLPDDKFKLFLTLFRFPVKTNELTGIMYDRLSRVFDGRNPAHNYQFLRSQDRDDWEYYRQNVLNEPTVWHTKAWDYFKTEINSILVVDMPSEQDPTDPYPQPYFYFLPIEHVIDYEVNPRTEILEYLIFKSGENKIIVIDEERYRVFLLKDQQITEKQIDNEHGLGYTPAKFFWNEPLSLVEKDIKKHPFSKILDSLDWYLFFQTSKRILDLYGAYPIYSGYEQACDFTNENGDECDGGYLRNGQQEYLRDPNGTELLKCPKCSGKRIVGVGSFIEVPAPTSKEDPDLRNPVQILGVEVSSLKYNVEEQERLKDELIHSVVGFDESLAVQEVAVNELQVNASFESQTTVLSRLKKGFEDAQNFVDSTICRLRYGRSFVSAKINLGTEFYVVNPQILRTQYDTAKKSGASEAELDALQNQILETEYRHDPTQLQRMTILSEIEPFRHLTREEVSNLFVQGIVSRQDYILKMNFSAFIKKFERENINILEFGVNLPFFRRVDVITNQLKQYADEYNRNLTVPNS